MNRRIITYIQTLLFAVYSSTLIAGEVYLVLGSDTAIWDGMTVSRYNCYYRLDLYTDPGRNAYGVMNPDFRRQFTDSYNQPVKMTWWMMAGNIFRYAENTNVPIPNIMTMYLMKKYHGDNVGINEDELSLHYHTFHWSDYDKDGVFYWNQSLSFLECLDDFNFTLAQFLIDEHVFPVSFRSGWHYMDNDWQHYLDERVLPYSMHNDWPADRTDTTEPLDNTYHWSLAPSDFVPWHPSSENYQLPGEGPGWNVRSKHFSGVQPLNLMEKVFAEAAAGTDQVACFWGHLPETDFLTNIALMDSLAHAAAAKYPGVNFRYCTAVETMQLWRGNRDTQSPDVQFTDELNGDYVTFRITADEPLFQKQPFVAVKDVYERYEVLECTPVGENEWVTTQPVMRRYLAKAAVAVCDTMGNQTLECIDYLPDDVFIDNGEAGYTEICGAWRTSSEASWGTDSRLAVLSPADSAKVQWFFEVPRTALYNIFIQQPGHPDAADSITVMLFSGEQPVDTVEFYKGIPAEGWVFISTNELQADSDVIIEMKARGEDQAGKVLIADVVKVTPLVRDRFLQVLNGHIDFGQVSVEDTVSLDLQIRNQGIQDLHVDHMYSIWGFVEIGSTFPMTIPAMAGEMIPLTFTSEFIGSMLDTLVIESDDPLNPVKHIPVNAEVLNYFKIVDNEDAGSYEEYGDWQTSNAEAYGPSSRYAQLNASPRAWARFRMNVKKTGAYELFEIVPKTENASNDALYQIVVDGTVWDSVYVDQNKGSGGWVSLGEYIFPRYGDIEIKVIDTANSTAGAVLRADAVKASLIVEATIGDEDREGEVPSQFGLCQNYPNPFNPSTRIRYSIPDAQHVTIDVYNTLGQKIETLLDKRMPAGIHDVEFRVQNLSSGIYYYRMEAGTYRQVRKMVVVK